MPPLNICQKSDQKAQIARLEIPVMIQDMIDRLDLNQSDKTRRRYMAKVIKKCAGKSTEVNILTGIKKWIKPYLMHVDGPSLKEVRALVRRWSC